MPTTLSRHLRLYLLLYAVFVLGLMTPQSSEAQTASSPVAAFMTPMVANVSDPEFTLTITGGGFLTGSVVYWNNQPLSTKFSSANQVSANVTPQLLVTAGQFQVFVLNPNGSRSNTLTFTVNAAAVAITTASLPEAIAGAAYSQILTASGGISPYTWSADGLPQGLTLAATGQLTGIPTTRGSFTLTIRVSDSTQRSATKTFTLSVAAPALAIATNATLPPATEGVEYRHTLVAENVTAPLRWSGSGLPPEVVLDGATGVLRGIPTTRGTYTFSVQVSDRANLSATKTFTLVVQIPPLVIATFSPLFNAVTGSAYSQTFAGTGGTPPYTWSLRPPVPGLTLGRTTGVLAGTPEQAGAHSINVQLEDATGTITSKDFTLTIEEPQLRITNSSPLPSGSVDTPYQQRFLATGGRQPYTWAITSATVSGFTLDAATGILSATPTIPGSLSLTVLVRDSAGVTASRTFALTIAPGSIKLSPIPDAIRSTAGEPFLLSISASGGAPPYTWAVNGLPEGLDIDSAGQITGAAHVPGSYPFTVRVTDSARASVTELFKLDISAPAVPVLRVSGLPDVSKAADQATLRLELGAPYSLPISGQLSISFAPEAGTGDPAVQFSTGGRTLDFQIPPGTTDAQLAASSVGLQTGTVAGTITLLLRMQTPGANLTPTPTTLQTIRIERSAPVITSASFSRTATGIEVRITGYSTAREVTQGTFRFTAAAGNPLSTSELILPLEEAFGRWFRDAESSQYGGQFTFAQQFTVQGDTSAVTPQSITLTNRLGATTFNIR